MKNATVFYTLEYHFRWKNNIYIINQESIVGVSIEYRMH